MANHIYTSSFEAPADLAGRCPSPTKGVHKCVFCAKTTARVREDAWKGRHPSGGSVPQSYSILPEDHPSWGSLDLGWRLFLWSCSACIRSWYSYKYYLACNEVPASTKDYLPPDPSTMRELPRTPPADATMHESNSQFLFGERGQATPANSHPVRTSSLPSKYWTDPRHMSTGSSTSGFNDPATQFPPTPAYSATYNSAAADMAGTMAIADFMDTRNFTCSVPEYSDADMAELDKMLNQRHTFAAPEKKHNRGDNFDHSNFVHMRKLGACLTCKGKKRKCDPTHVHMNISSSSSKA